MSIHLDQAPKCCAKISNICWPGRYNSHLWHLPQLSDTVFGCPLGKLCARQKVAVPRVITDCVEAIEYRGLKSGGIYRISGNSASIQKLRSVSCTAYNTLSAVQTQGNIFWVQLIRGFSITLWIEGVSLRNRRFMGPNVALPVKS